MNLLPCGIVLLSIEAFVFSCLGLLLLLHCFVPCPLPLLFDYLFADDTVHYGHYGCLYISLDFY